MRTDLINHHIERNSETAGLRDSYRPHRQRVMQLIEATVRDLAGVDDTRTLSSIVLLGAGNCHDVSLNRLAELFRRIHLVDVDLSAIGNASAASCTTDGAAAWKLA